MESSKSIIRVIETDRFFMQLVLFEHFYLLQNVSQKLPIATIPRLDTIMSLMVIFRRRY